MAVKVRVTADTELADKAIQKSQESAAQGYKKLEALASEGLKSEKIKSAFEGLKKVTEVMAPELDEISKGLGANVKASFEMAEGGAKIGAMFGPLGALIGGAIGAVTGYFLSARRQAEEVKKQIAATKAEITATRDRLAELDDVSFENVIAEVDKWRDKIKAGGEEAKLARQFVLELLGVGATDLAEAYDKAAESADKAKEATIAILKPVELTADQARDKINESADLIKEVRSKLVEESSKIKEAFYTSPQAAETILKSQSKLLIKLKEQLAQYTEEQTEAAKALRTALDKEIKDEEESNKKKQENAQKAREKRAKMIEEDSKKLSLIAQSAIDDLELEKAANEERIKSEEEWAETVKRVSYEVNIARLQSSENLKKIQAEEKERRQKELEEQKAMMQAAFDEQKAGFEAALQPFADVASQVFGSIQANIEAGKRPLEGFKQAFRSAIGDVLKSLGKQWGAQALSELAAGFAALALGPIGGVTAGQHFTAAALYGSAAVAAGLGGAALSKSSAPSSGSSSSPAPSSGSGSSNPSLGKTNSGNSSGGTVIVTLSGNMFLEGNERTVARAGAIIGNAIGASNTATFLDTGVKRAA